MIKNLCHGGEWHLLKRIKNEQDGQNDHSAKRIENWTEKWKAPYNQTIQFKFCKAK